MLKLPIKKVGTLYNNALKTVFRIANYTLAVKFAKSIYQSRYALHPYNLEGASLFGHQGRLKM